MDKPQSNLSFRMMSLMFKIRDLFKSRVEVLEETGIQRGDNVLDFGCGPGRYIKPLVKMVGPEGKIFALDMNPQAIRTVKNFVLKNQITNIETILSDLKTGLADSSMDYVLLFDVLHHLKDPETVLEEIHHVLKVEGTFAMSDHHMDDEEIKKIIIDSGYFRLRTRGINAFLFSKVV